MLNPIAIGRLEPSEADQAGRDHSIAVEKTEYGH